LKFSIHFSIAGGFSKNTGSAFIKLSLDLKTGKIFSIESLLNGFSKIFKNIIAFSKSLCSACSIESCAK
jgi:hypothetical protein